MSNESKDAVFKGTLSEDVRLENLGYEQGMRSSSQHVDTSLADIASRTQAIFWPAGYDWV